MRITNNDKDRIVYLMVVEASNYGSLIRVGIILSICPYSCVFCDKNKPENLTLVE
jgi:hypothetical protein